MKLCYARKYRKCNKEIYFTKCKIKYIVNMKWNQHTELVDRMQNKVMTVTFDNLKRLIDETSVKCKLEDRAAWYKVYKDIVFNKTMLYYSDEIVGFSIIKKPFIMTTGWPSDGKSYFSIQFDTITLYVHNMSENKMKEIVSDLEKKYKTCLTVYECMKEQIDSFNKQFQEMILTKSFVETSAYMNQKEKEFNSMLKDLTKICIF